MIGGLGLGWLVYKNFKAGDEDPVKKLLGPVYKAMKNKYYFDEAYDFLFVQPAKWFSEKFVFEGMDRKVIDGILAVAAPFIPAPAQPLLPFASSLLVLGLSTRARKHAGKALSASLRGNIGEAISYVLKGIGAKHSNDTADGVLAGAIKVAEHQVARGELDIAKLEALKEAQAKLEA